MLSSCTPARGVFGVRSLPRAYSIRPHSRPRLALRPCPLASINRPRHGSISSSRSCAPAPHGRASGVPDPPIATKRREESKAYYIIIKMVRAAQASPDSGFGLDVCARTHQDARARSSLPFILPTPSAAARPAQGERHRLVAGSTLSALPGPASRHSWRVDAGLRAL